MTAKQHIDNCIKSLDKVIASINNINDTLRKNVPICNECHTILSFAEVQERLANGLNVLGDNIVCDKCYAEWQARKFTETRHPDE